ncbi:MAG: IS21 family transposase [Veillonellales bacterium]
MLTMSQINEIREAFELGKKVSQIARELEIDEKTVRKYLKQEDFSPTIPVVEEHTSRLDPYKPRIQQWLDGDVSVWYKQRHTAQRVYDRLKAECPKFALSYPTVQRFVKEYKRKLQQTKTIQELVWYPGEAQVDFGEADFYEKGVLCRKKYLTVSFPYSNRGFCQVFGGETGECVCQGLKDIFEYIGGVARVLVFDNATGVGRRVGDNIREAQLFQQMRAHYGFLVRFCNPNAGHEKGNVENKVGTVRRNWFVPIPSFDHVEQYNRFLLEAGPTDDVHYKKGRPIAELFKEDQRALKPFRFTKFRAGGIEVARVQPYLAIAVSSHIHKPADIEWRVRQIFLSEFLAIGNFFLKYTAGVFRREIRFQRFVDLVNGFP